MVGLVSTTRPLLTHPPLLTPRDAVAGWADQLLLRMPFSPAHPSEHILIVRGLRARKLAARLAVTATPSPHTPSLAGSD
jgi:hypothetical protein